MAEGVRLDEQGRLLEIAFDKMKQGLCFFDREQRLIACNRRYAEIYSLSFEAMTPGTTLKEIAERRRAAGTCPEMDDTEYLRWRDRIATVGRTHESTVKLCDGRTIAIHHEPIASGGWVSTHDDITATVEAQRRVTASEERHRVLVQTSALMVWRATPDGTVTEASGWELFSRDNIQGSHAKDWVALIHPADQDNVRATWRAAGAAGSPYSVEYRISRVDGAHRWVISRGVPLREADGSIREWVGTVSDIDERKQAEDSLRASERRYRLAARATQDAIWDWDLATDTVAWGENSIELFGHADPTAEWWTQTVHPDDRERALASLVSIIHGSDNRWTEQYRFARKDGTYADVLDRGFVIRDDQGNAVRMVGAMQDVTERKRSEEALRRGEQRLQLALKAGRMMAWEHDVATGFVERSENGLTLFGLTSGPLSAAKELIHPDDLARVEATVREGGAESRTVEFRYIRPDGHAVWVGMRSQRQPDGRNIGVTFDISDRKHAELEAWRLAHQDPLTGLPNRFQFQARFEEALSSAQRNGTAVSLLLLDLDDFKDVNDTLGHDAGDALLKATADRLRRMARDCDTVARVGGDEFAILVVEPLTLEHAVRFAEHVVDDLKTPFAYNGRLVASRSSIGVAGFPDHDRTFADLMKDADIALYRAKAQGRSRVVAYVPSMRAEMERRFAVAGEFRAALADAQIVPFYQPKVCLSSGRIVGFEALARWQHPTKGVLTPGYFGVAFEDPEIAEMVGEAMARQVAADVAAWLRAGFDCGRVALNLSSAEFRQHGLAEAVLATLEQAGVPTANFEVEVTETVFLGASSDLVATTLNRFREAGVSIALDDFGTGFASLSHLKQFPVDHIKIDQSFVRGLERSKADEAIVSAVVALGRNLGMHVTAEGVETDQQAVSLRDLGCEAAQGYLFAKPMPGSRVPWLLRTSPTLGLEGRPRRIA
jgi:diguanylate cyclase (GGDEF)-like protein/PAS domain S-box-containing protein